MNFSVSVWRIRIILIRIRIRIQKVKKFITDPDLPHCSVYSHPPKLKLFFISRELDIPAACTLRSNRMLRCPLKSEKELKKEGRGAMDYQLSDSGVLVVRWYDNKEVNVATTAYSAEPVSEVRRWDKAKKKYVYIKRPAVVGAYNKGMGGVDNTDQKMAFYRIDTKTIKWYKRMAYHFVDLTLVNSYILRKAVTGQEGLPLFKFKLDVALSLMFAENFGEPMSAAVVLLRQQGEKRAENGDPVGDGEPVDAVRLDGHNHWPDNVASDQRRCRLPGCKKKSVVWCAKCKVYLCLKKDRNCFVRYHTV